MTAQPGLAQDALQLYPYGNSGRQRVKGFGSVRQTSTACGNMFVRCFIMHLEPDQRETARSDKAEETLSINSDNISDGHVFNVLEPTSTRLHHNSGGRAGVRRSQQVATAEHIHVL